MYKILLVIFFLLLIDLTTKAQDLIFKRNGEEIKGKVKGVGVEEIEYTEESTEGVNRKILKSEVAIILYSNGMKDIFELPIESTSSNGAVVNQPTTPNRPHQKYFKEHIFYEKVPMVFLGIDFSRTVFRDFFAGPDMLFETSNYQLFDQMILYYSMDAFRRSDIQYNNTIIDKQNQQIDWIKLKGDRGSTLQVADIQAIVDQYDLSASGITEGLGLVCLCRVMRISKNLPTNSISYQSDRVMELYYVIFDITSKNMLVIELVNGRGDSWLEAARCSIFAVKNWKYHKWYRDFGDK